MIRRSIRALALALVFVPAVDLGAQQPAAPRERAQLERRFREQLAARIQKVLGATDAQMRALVPINREYEEERRALLADERRVRLGLRAELRSDSASDARVGGLVDELLALQQRRLDLVQEEQRALARVLTPTQRARYLVMQDQMRRRLEEIRSGEGGTARRRGRPRDGP